MKIDKGIMSVELEEFIDDILRKKYFEFLIERGFLKDEKESSDLFPRYKLQTYLNKAWAPDVVKNIMDYFNGLKAHVNNWFKPEVNEALEEKEAPYLNAVNELKKEGMLKDANDITKKGNDAVVRRIDEFIRVKVKTTQKN